MNEMKGIFLLHTSVSKQKNLIQTEVWADCNSRSAKEGYTIKLTASLLSYSDVMELFFCYYLGFCFHLEHKRNTHTQGVRSIKQPIEVGLLSSTSFKFYKMTTWSPNWNRLSKRIRWFQFKLQFLSICSFVDVIVALAHIHGWQTSESYTYAGLFVLICFLFFFLNSTLILVSIQMYDSLTITIRSIRSLALSLHTQNKFIGFRIY